MVHAQQVGRFLLVGCGTLTVAYATGDPVLALWFLCYIATQVIYLGHLWRQRQPLSRLAYPLAVALNVLTSSRFLALPLYLWHQHTPMFQAAAVLMIWGHSAFNLSRRGGVRADRAGCSRYPHYCPCTELQRHHAIAFGLPAESALVRKKVCQYHVRAPTWRNQ